MASSIASSSSTTTTTTNHLVNQWRDRVADVTKDINAAKDEMKSLQEQSQLLNKEHNHFTVVAKKERAQLHAELKQAETRAKGADDSLKASASMKLEAEHLLTAAARDYEDMSAAVRRLQELEVSLRNREDLKLTLETESTAWADEEHQLRSQLQTIENQIRTQRKKCKVDLAQEETKLQDALNELESSRKARRPEEGLEPVELPRVATF